MHVMFIHPNFPAQFGTVANVLVRRHGWKATFITSVDTTQYQLPFVHVNYRIKPGPTPKTFYNPGRLEDLMAHLPGVYNAAKQLRKNGHPDPDLVVGHVSYGTMLYLKNLYKCPFVGYYELLPPAFWSEELALREDYPPAESVRLFNATYHALTYLHLHSCDAIYTPTQYQKTTAPAMFQDRIRVIFDGIDTQLFRPATEEEQTTQRPCQFHGVNITPETKLITYVSRGLESVRGFDIFMKAAKKVYQNLDNVQVLIAGEPRTAYGHELPHIKEKTFKDHVLKSDEYDMSKIHFLNRIPLTDLAMMYRLSDCHIYLTRPYVLSWSFVQALAAGCRVVGSDTAPVREAVDDDVHGLLADFYDADAIAERAMAILKDPDGYKRLGVAARERVMERYDLEPCLSQLIGFYGEVVNGKAEAGPAANSAAATITNPSAPGDEP